jgi:hypothetical protein
MRSDGRVTSLSIRLEVDMVKGDIQRRALVNGSPRNHGSMNGPESGGGYKLPARDKSKAKSGARALILVSTLIAIEEQN